MGRDNGETPSTSTGLMFLAAPGRQRLAIVGAAARDAKRTAAEAEQRRKDSWGECQRIAVQLAEARGKHFDIANEARRAKAQSDDAHLVLRREVSDAYVTWKRQHHAEARDLDRFFREMGEACGMPAGDLARLIGHRGVRRTAAEREEDFQRYRTGVPIRTIARSRGLRRSAIQKDIHVRLARALIAKVTHEGAATHDATTLVAGHPSGCITGGPPSADLAIEESRPSHARHH